MSFISKMLGNSEVYMCDKDITKFLLLEGFDYFPAGLNEIGMRYVAGNDLYYVQIDFHKDRFLVYVEYECGEELDRKEFNFLNNKSGNFLKAYFNSIEWAKEYVNPN